MATWSCLHLCVLLSLLAVLHGQTCSSVNDILPQLPKDLQDLLKKRMDVYTYKGTLFVPSATAWTGKDFDSNIYQGSVLETIIDFGIIPGVRFAERPALKTGTEQLESKFQDSSKLLCLNAARPTKKVNVELAVTGKPSATDQSRYLLEGTPGNKYTAGEGEIQIVRVYSDIVLDTLKNLNISNPAALKDVDPKVLNSKLNVSDLASWSPANVVKVVQCTNADVFFMDHVLLPCPLCGKKCSAFIIQGASTILLPVLSGLTLALAIAGFVAICCGCNLCANADGCCGCFWKCVCRSLVLIIVLLEVCTAAVFILLAWYFKNFERQGAMVDKKKWQPFFAWSVAGAVVTGVVAISHVWSFISQAAKRKRNVHKQFTNAPPPPMYQPVGAAAPIRA